ncbi:putative flippase GtrA [Neisseria perflava]|uniref:GtrA family protein n=1 Tax=Neisseria perflava TaxID=33053 RepID=UPI00209DF35E|nr:GtrA family protein [Neisseria perflava]MCP1772814.1 putative flippase GtrA [Neisseria perflava]
MSAIRHTFPRYTVAGIANTLLHWLALGILVSACGWPHAPANLLAFFIAVSFSFWLNAKWTFRRPMSSRRYLAFVGVMAALALFTGLLTDYLQWPVAATAVMFSAVSWLGGFWAAHFWVFRDNKGKT